MPVSIDVPMPEPALATALATSAALDENAGGTVVPAAGAIVHCASVSPQTFVGGTVVETPSIAEALRPVSSASTARSPDVLT